MVNIWEIQLLGLLELNQGQKNFICALGESKGTLLIKYYDEKEDLKQNNLDIVAHKSDINNMNLSFNGLKLATAS